ncbi:MAG: hypothetical protein ACFCGT_15690 [Sandaracinaceae bacterium]
MRTEAGDPAGHPYLDDGLVVHLEAAADEQRDYDLAMEALENTTVLLAEDGEIRLETRFFLNAGVDEWIIVDAAIEDPSFSHWCMPRDIESGRYDADATDAVCLEVLALLPGGGAGGTTADHLAVDLEVRQDAIEGRVEGDLVRHDDPDALVPVLGWFHSDRVDTGGW